MLETIKTVGSFAGLISAAFLIWDRWVRGRPLVGPKIKLAGVNPFKYIRIENPGPGEVFVQGVRAYQIADQLGDLPPIVPSRIYAIAKDHSHEEVLQATVPELYGVGELQFLLRAGGKCDLPIIEPREPKTDPPSKVVLFVVSWRKTNSALWQVPLWFTISTRGFDRMAAAADRDNAESLFNKT
jgi:hypothetical protein